MGLWLRLASFAVGFGAATAPTYYFIVKPTEARHEQHIAHIAAAETNQQEHSRRLEERLARLEQSVGIGSGSPRLA